jgi:prepilin-type N-terminal cleavage/methylation domain-containing protein
MKSLNKSAFTMIELIFVIVILGILSAVALPKMLGVQKSAQAQKVESFVSTMNRTTLPSMYVSAIRSNGSIKSMTLSDYIDLPSEVTALTLNSCGSGTFASAGTTSIGATIYCRDGNSSSMPVLSFSSSDLNTTLADSYFQ